MESYIFLFNKKHLVPRAEEDGQIIPAAGESSPDNRLYRQLDGSGITGRRSMAKVSVGEE